MKKAILFRKTLLFLVALSPFTLYAQEGRLIDQIHNHTSGLAAWWAGQDSWLIKKDNQLFATDLYFEDNVRYDPSPITAEELCKDLDILFITHEHDDHFHAKTCKTLNEKSTASLSFRRAVLPKRKKLEFPIKGL
jgi:accessory colonization factor AcfC